MKLTCQLTNQEFEYTEQERQFIERMGLKNPIYSPQVREVMRMAFRNERTLFIRNCDGTGEKMLSVYGPHHKYKVYKYDYWVTDKWDPPSLDYDFEKPFFEQYAELAAITPRVNLFAPYNENCDYVNAAEKNKNCYMHILSDRSEDCMYTHAVHASRDCIESAYLHGCELSWEITDCRNCYHCRMCFLCDNSSDLTFCYDMRGCKNCFFSWGLRNQEYYFFNKKLTKEQYESEIAKIDLKSYQTFQKYNREFQKEIAKAPYVRMVNTENSDVNFLINTKNCHKCFDVESAEDCYWLRLGANNLRDVHHSYAIVDDSELIYGNISTTESYNCHNMIGCWTTKNSAYSEFLQGCQDCLGCISLRHKKFCILNKQYSEQEYKKIRDHVIAELGDYWGSPFPLKLAPFSYKESVYSDYYTLTPQQCESLGWSYGQDKAEPKTAQGFSKLPDHTDDFGSDQLSKIFQDPKDDRPYKIIKPELALLKKIGAPLPRQHFENRFFDRIKYRKQAEANA